MFIFCVFCPLSFVIVIMVFICFFFTNILAVWIHIVNIFLKLLQIPSQFTYGIVSVMSNFPLIGVCLFSVVGLQCIVGHGVSYSCDRSAVMLFSIQYGELIGTQGTKANVWNQLLYAIFYKCT